MKTFTYKTIIRSIMVVFLPVMVSCSVFSGGNPHNDPAITAQQQEIQALEQEVREAERFAEEAKQREKAAKNRLKAAEHELKALQEQVKRRNSY